MYKVLIVEDDKTISNSISKYLKKWDYDTKQIDNFRNVVERFHKFKPHLVLLDITLPFFNGYYWCNEIRKVSEVPIIFISSTGDDMNIVKAMDMGGDDFIVKPFDLTVLVAKVNALIRRTYSFGGGIDTLEHGEVVLNLGTAEIIYKGKKEELTKNEFKIIKVLMENKGNIVSRNKLMVSLWETESFIDDNTLTVNIGRLRRKLEEVGITDFIKTKQGLGYMVD